MVDCTDKPRNFWKSSASKSDTVFKVHVKSPFTQVNYKGVEKIIQILQWYVINFFLVIQPIGVHPSWNAIWKCNFVSSKNLFSLTTLSIWAYNQTQCGVTNAVPWNWAKQKFWPLLGVYTISWNRNFQYNKVVHYERLGKLMFIK